jgi:hypothetical protein
MNLLYSVALAAALASQQPSSIANPKAADGAACPLHEQHMAEKKASSAHSGHAAKDSSSADERFAEMNARGNRTMGFDQAKTTHQFRTLEDGGAIEVTVNDPADSANLLAIRTHLKQVAADFTKGDFRSPLATHDEMPAGVEGMQAAKDKISYKYEEMANGGRVRIGTQDASALEAVHRFLGYQVTEHRTGDAAHKH